MAYWDDMKTLYDKTTESVLRGLGKGKAVAQEAAAAARAAAPEIAEAARTGVAPSAELATAVPTAGDGSSILRQAAATRTPTPAFNPSGGVPGGLPPDPLMGSPVHPDVAAGRVAAAPAAAAETQAARTLGQRAGSMAMAPLRGAGALLGGAARLAVNPVVGIGTIGGLAIAEEQERSKDVIRDMPDATDPSMMGANPLGYATQGSPLNNFRGMLPAPGTNDDVRGAQAAGVAALPGNSALPTSPLQGMDFSQDAAGPMGTGAVPAGPTQLEREPGITKTIDPKTGRVTYSGKDVVSPDSPTKEQVAQAQALAAKDKAALVAMVGARAAEGDREGVARITAGIQDKDVQAAREKGFKDAATESKLRQLPPKRQAVLRAKLEESRATRETTAATKATENAIKQREADIKALQLRMELDKNQRATEQQKIDNEQKALAQAGERDKQALSQLETQYGDKAAAARAFSDMNSTLASQAERANKIDPASLTPTQRKWLDMTTKRVGSEYQPKSIGDLSITERDRLHGANMIRAGLERQLQSQSGLINKLTPNYWFGADGTLSDDLSKFDPGNFKVEGNYLVGTGAAKGVRIPTRSLVRFDEQGMPQQRGWVSDVTGIGGPGGLPSDTIMRRAGK